LYVFFWEIFVQVLCPFLVSWVAYMFWIVTPLSDIWFAHIFSQFVDTPNLENHPVDCFLCSSEAFYIDAIPFVYFWLCILWFWGHIQKLIAQTNAMKLSSYIFFNSFVDSDLIFKSLIHLSWLCVWCETRVQFHYSVCGYPVFPTPFIEKTFFSPLCVFDSFVENQ
jgi:hypothetical protein